MIELVETTGGAAMIRPVVSAVFGLAGIVAVWAVEAPAYGAQQKSPDNPGVQQGDKSQEACIARRQREGLSTRFAANRCVNLNN